MSARPHTVGNLHAVIMAGGSGTRFWPASRVSRPKQLLPLAYGETMIRATVARLDGLLPAERIWIVTNEDQAEAIESALPGFSRERLIIEPEPRDTAPCVALATATIEAAAPDAILVMLPADHLVEPVTAFCDMLRRGAEIAADGDALVTFGVVPTWPATGYGYIEPGEAIDGAEPRARRVTRFREKPDLETAREFVATRKMLWNSGIFVWSTRALLRAMDAGSGGLAASTRAMLDAARAGDTVALAAAFSTTPRTSIDYAVLESAPEVAVVDADIEWNDVGSFLALGDVAPADADRNVHSLHGGASFASVDASDCVVYAEGQRTVVLLGAEGLVVVAVDDAILVCPKERAHELKRVVALLRDQGRTDLL